MKQKSNFPPEMLEAFDKYIQIRKEHEALLKRKGDFPTISAWQDMVREADRNRRYAHNQAARLMIYHGYAPRFENDEESLRNARELILLFFGFS